MFAPQELKTKVTADRKVVIPFPENIPIGATVKVTYDVQVIEVESLQVPVSFGEVTPDFASLETLYTWDDERVLPFLTANPSLVGFLIEARPAIARYFEDATCELEVEYDLVEDGQLNLYIVTKLRTPKSFEMLERFDQEWWLPRRGGTGGKLSIHTKHDA